MRMPSHRAFTLRVAAVACAVTSCAHVPKEVVELSYRMGQDITVVHASYRLLVHRHFEGLREQRVRYLTEEWAPRFISRWVEDGRLIDVATGKVIWSAEQEAFVPPNASTAQADLLQTVQFWAQAAIDELQEKRDTLLRPLNLAEDSLSRSVDEAFRQLYNGNSAITAHLNSLRKVQEVQNDLLAALDLKPLRDKIDSAIANASEEAQGALEAVRAADSLPAKAERLLKKRDG